MSAVPDFHPVLTSKEAAAFLKVGVSTLARWRQHQRGPACIPYGPTKTMYRLSVLNAWLDSRTQINGGKS
jgi:hypothetical protein